MNYIKYIMLLSMCLMLSCTNKPKSDKSTKAITKNTENWKCIAVDNDKICTPSNWKLYHQSKYLFFSYLNNPDTDTFFTVLKYNESTTGININDYLKGYYSELKSNMIEKCTGYTTKQLVMPSITSYYSEFHTQLDNKPFITYSMIFDNDNSIYEFTLKLDSAHFEGYRAKFKEILFNYRHNNKVVFSSTDKIKEIKTIDLSKL